MEKRYQIFVSSTFVDLKQERDIVFKTILEMDHIPVGMELFPATDEEQFTFIKRVIDDSDYYVLLIGGRYGSTDGDGVSYTEKEYDYAVSKGIKIVTVLHKEPDSLPVNRVDTNIEMQEKLTAFKQKVTSRRLAKFWQTPNELSGIIATSLSKTFKMYPASGWVRNEEGNATRLLQEINELRKEKEKTHNILVKRRNLEVSVLSHELRTPLNGILGIADYLKNTPEISTEHAKAIQIIFASGKNLLDTIEVILARIKLQEESYIRDFQKLDIRRILEKALKHFGDNSKLANIPSKLSSVSGDLSLINTLMLQISSLVYMSKNSSLTTTEDDTSIFINVESGTIVSSKTFNELFEYDTALKITRRFTLTQGDFWLMKQIVNLHDGKIEAFQSVDGELALTISLPKTNI